MDARVAQYNKNINEPFSQRSFLWFLLLITFNFHSRRFLLIILI